MMLTVMKKESSDHRSVSPKASERRLVENEVVFRQLNEQVQKGIDENNRLAKEAGQNEFVIEYKDDVPLHFYCECSDENCTKRVILTYREYNKIHERRDYFIIAPGHQVVRVEKVIRKESNYYI